MRLICNSIGLNKETEVIHNGRRLVTQGLSIEQLCNLWRWYYNIAPFEKKIELVFSVDRDYSAIHQRTLSSCRSVKRDI